MSPWQQGKDAVSMIAAMVEIAAIRGLARWPALWLVVVASLAVVPWCTWAAKREDGR